MGKFGGHLNIETIVPSGTDITWIDGDTSIDRDWETKEGAMLPLKFRMK